jgi:hypothetical protein
MNFLIRPRENISKLLEKCHLLLNFIFRELFPNKDIFNNIMGHIYVNGDGFLYIHHISLGVDMIPSQGIYHPINTPTHG